MRIIRSTATVLTFALALLLTVFAVPAHAAKPSPAQASIVINQLSPYYVGDVLTFTTTIPKLAGWEYPTVAVACYQDVDNDGAIEHGWPWDDVVYTELVHPGESVTLGGYSSIWKDRGGGFAECDADLDAYGWKGGQQFVRVLASQPFTAS